MPNTPIKILHVIPGLAPQYGGPSKIVLELSEALRARGLSSEIAATDADGLGTLSVPLGEFTEYQGERAIFFHRNFSESFKYAPGLSRWLDKHVENFDMLHIHAVFSHSTLAAAKAALRHCVPYVIRPLGTLEPWSMHQKALKKKIAWHLCFKPLVQQASFVHYTTRNEQELTEQSLGLTNGRVIPNGLSPKFLTDTNFMIQNGTKKSAERTFLFLSRIAPKKGLELLIRTFSALSHQCPHFQHKLLIAGRGEYNYMKSLIELSNQLGISEQLIWKDWVEGPEKQRILLQADALILPSQQENFGNALLEAMACATPVITTAVTGLANVIAAHNCGWIIEPTGNSLSKALLEVMTKESVRRQRGENGRRLVEEHYAWPALATLLIQYYRQALDTGKYAHS